MIGEQQAVSPIDELAGEFDRLGCVRVPGLLASDALARLEDAFERLVAGGDWIDVDCGFYDTARWGWDGPPRTMVAGLGADPRFAWLTELRAVRELASGLFGAGAVHLDTVASRFNCDTLWHDDGQFTLGRGRHALVTFALDPIDGSTGALRAVPGSHLRPRGPEALPSVVLASNPGDAVVIDFDVAHASFGGRVGRRVVHLMFGARAT